MRKRSPISSEKQRLIKEVFIFEIDHPREFKSLKTLLAKVKPKIGDDELHYQLGNIVYGFKRRFQDPGYAKNLGLLKTKLLLAASALNQAKMVLQEIDSIHSELFDTVVAEEPTVGYAENLSLVLIDLGWIPDQLQAVAHVVDIITAPETKNRGRSRPPLPYLMPVLDLIVLWESATGELVVSPKGTQFVARDKKAEAIQNSTEFIRLGLTMIDPRVTAANAVTITRAALKARKALAGSDKKLEPISFAIQAYENRLAKQPAQSSSS